MKTAGVVVLAIVLVIGLMHALHRPEGVTKSGEWTCSMHPSVRQSGPGQCPFCGMDLEPVREISKEQARIETEPVANLELVKEIRTVGKIDYNEARVAHIAARIAGRVDRLYADFTGIDVRKEDHLAQIYSPDLFVAQEELIAAADSYERTGRPEEKRLLEAARTKLKLWGMLPRQIRDIESARKVQTHLTIYAPIGGTIIEKSIREGQYVKEGDMLYRIANLDPLWLYLEIYEYDIAWVRYGQPVEVSVEAYPGQTFPGMVMFIDPFLDDKTRAVRVRVNLPNPEKKLKPNMYAKATLK
ncbi:MAG: efflux RND transporter periplasmic adaptor subunit, partial [Gemmataceae bacterium]